MALNLSYLCYCLTAGHKRGFGIHSPFLYHLVKQILGPCPLPPPGVLEAGFSKAEWKYGRLIPALAQAYEIQGFSCSEKILSHPSLAYLPRMAGIMGIPLLGTHFDANMASQEWNPSPLMALDPTDPIPKKVFDTLPEHPCFILFPGIRLSKSSYSGWEQLKNHPDLPLSVDLYHVGIGISRRGLPNQRMTIRY